MNVTSSGGVVTANLAGLPADDGLKVFADVLSPLSADIATDNSFSSPGHCTCATGGVTARCSNVGGGRHTLPDHTCPTRLHLPDD